MHNNLNFILVNDMFFRYSKIMFITVLATLFAQLTAASGDPSFVQNMDPDLLMRKPTFSGSSTITGRVIQNSQAPLASGTVFLFDASTGPPPSPINYFRVSNKIMRLDEYGKFTFEVGAGTYYLVASARFKDNDFGPPKDGEAMYFIANTDGTPKAIKIAANSNLDIGTLTKVLTFWKDKIKSDTSIEGVVEDPSGKPVAGAKVIAFAAIPDREQPLFAAEQTEKDGKFILRLYEGGSYILKSRSVYGGGIPTTGETVDMGSNSLDGARYGFEQAFLSGLPVTLKTGQKLKGLRLVIKKFSPGAPEGKTGNNSMK